MTLKESNKYEVLNFNDFILMHEVHLVHSCTFCPSLKNSILLLFNDWTPLEVMTLPLHPAPSAQAPPSLISVSLHKSKHCLPLFTSAVSIALLCEAEEACQVSLNPSKRQQEAASSRLSHYDTITRWHQTHAAMALTSRSLPVNLFGVQEHFGPVHACKSTIMTHTSDKTNVASADVR